MSKILIYENRKCDPIMYLADTEERELLAYAILFQDLDENWQVYQELSKPHQKLYDEAKAGNKESARKLLKSRKNNEYEYVTEQEIFDPLEEIEQVPFD